MSREYYVVPNFVPSEPVQHSEERPFCDDMSCPCKEDQDAITVVAQHVADGLMTISEADQMYRGRTL